jgi:AcrR family transcriptional regulator
MLKKQLAEVDWKESRRQAARATILEAAWSLVREDGLAALSLRDLARRAGISTPTVYAYFESKNDIYDAMFGQAAAQFEDHMAAPYDAGADRALLVAEVQRFVTFCTSDLARYQLLFQRTVPGFNPSPASYAPAIRALAGARDRLALIGITAPEHLDIWTALSTGLVDQQISNDLGGDRWVRLVDDFVDMFLLYCAAPKRTKPPHRKPPARGNRGTR